MIARAVLSVLPLLTGLAGAAENYAYDPAKMHALQKQRCQKFLDQKAVIEKRERFGINRHWDLEKMAVKKAELQKQFDSDCQPVKDELLAPAAKTAKK